MRAAFAALAITACRAAIRSSPRRPRAPPLATFASGCFWCTEAVYQRLRGVETVASGYIGGSVEFPTYEAVCTGRTGHAEAIQIKYNPKEISYETLLEVFFKTHDPTTLNRQGADSGTQYRSAIFFHGEAQKKSAEAVKQKASAWWPNPIVTEVSPATVFYPAEDYTRTITT
jgi:peptide-methionine (S)-S-oxide reductase